MGGSTVLAFRIEPTLGSDRHLLNDIASPVIRFDGSLVHVLFRGRSPMGILSFMEI